MKTTFLIILGVAALLGVAHADEQVICTAGDQIRTIVLDYEQEGSPLPCEVHYKKSTGTQTLWRAEDEVGYCERKMAEFIEKQRGWGWRCTKTEIIAPVSAEPSPEQPTDNDDLLDGIELQNP